MERLHKYVIVRGDKGQHKALAVIDTGTPRTVVPRRIAERVGTFPTGRKGRLNIKGTSGPVDMHEAEIEIVTGGCRSTIEILVPHNPKFDLLLVGSLFLQKTGATIVYRGEHPVFCSNGADFVEDSLSADFIEDVRRKKR